ncbi:MAG: hypothetical protein AAB853_00285 [Patescibacteria group bacterium]
MNSPPQAPVYETHFSSGKVDTRLVIPSYGADDDIWRYETFIPESMTGSQLTFFVGEEITQATDPRILAQTAQLAKKVHDDVSQMCRTEYNQQKLEQDIYRYVSTVNP